MTLTDAVKAAGGLTPYAERFRIIHTDGTTERYRYDNIKPHEKNDPVLRPGDTIWIVGGTF
jgi:hypothetical protein